MTNDDKNFTAFMKENTKGELKKPINEFSEILAKVEQKPKSIFQIPKWLYATTAVLTLSLFAAYFSATTSVSTQDEQLMTFLSSSLDDSNIYDDSGDEDITLLSLVE